MKIIVSIVLFFIFIDCFSQDKINRIVWDADNNSPIEFVNVYNSKQSTITNEQGRFSIIPKSDSIYFYRPGYDKLATTFKRIKDTVYIEKSLFKLDEVVVTNAKTIYQKIKDSVKQNYLLKPHTETFFLRITLRKNKSLIRLQDFYGKVNRKTSIYTGSLKLEKEDFQIQLEQMRKAGIGKESNGIYFTFPSFHQIYKESVRINAMGPNFTVTEKPFTDSNLIKVEFELEPNKEKTLSSGHYIINGADNAILSFNVFTKPFYKTVPEVNKHSSRPISREDVINFSKDVTNGFYFIKSAKRKLVYHIKSEKQTTSDTYELKITLNTLESFGSEKIKSNINEHKDVFKLNKNYNQSFWEQQNQLLFTEEMSKFITNYEKKGFK